MITIHEYGLPFSVVLEVQRQHNDGATAKQEVVANYCSRSLWNAG